MKSKISVVKTPSRFVRMGFLKKADQSSNPVRRGKCPALTHHQTDEKCLLLETKGGRDSSLILEDTESVHRMLNLLRRELYRRKK